MKNLLPLLLLFVALSASAGMRSSFTLGKTNGVQLGYGTQALLQTPMVKINRSLAFKPVVAMPDYDADKCRRYKGLLIGGAVALGAGVSLLTGGSILVHRGTGGVFGGIGEDADATMIIGGAVMIVWGVIGTAAGIPLLAIGASKTRQYCGSNGGRQSSSLNLELIKRGTGGGLALKF